MKSTVSKAKAFLKTRHQQVRRAMGKMKLDGLLLTHTPDVCYITEFTGDDTFALVTDKDIHLVSDFRYQEQIELECGWVKTTIREGKMSDAIAKLFERNKLKRVGFEANFTTVGQLDAICSSCKSLGIKTPELVSLDDVLSNIRKVKDDNEIELIRQSASLAEESFVAVRELIKPGLTENHIAGLLVSELRSRGAMMESFPPIVATGPHSSLPHYRPDDTLIMKDAPLLIDWGALFKGYCSDLTRTLLIGRVDPKIHEIYKVCHAAQQEALRFIRAGVTTVEADAVARDVITRAGYGQYFGHGLGHGIGREIHEKPALRKTGDADELRPGMIVTVEPGIYIKGLGGVRIEDDVLITHSGCEVLTSLESAYEASHIE